MLKAYEGALAFRGLAMRIAIAAFMLNSTWCAYAQVSIPGQFSVGESGAAHYSIPVEVLPGVAGLAPQLSLAYSSQGGNGLVGVGWQLSGLSVITRCPRTMAQDGVRGNVNFDVNDRFCLDGQRLLLTSGSYGSANSEYRTELEGYSKIVAAGSAGNGPASFTVQTKAGLRLEFGVTTDSRIEAQGKTSVAVWALNKITDAKGNVLTVAYTEDNANGSYRPASITYGGNTVSFSYEDRPDKVAQYQAGSKFTLTHRLSRIAVARTGQAANREYRLTYGQSANSLRSRLTTVQSCGMTGGVESCLTNTTVAWSDFGNKWVQPASKWSNQFGVGYRFQDVTQVNYAEDPAIFGISFGLSQPGQDISRSSWQLLDINRDAKFDLLNLAASWVSIETYIYGSRVQQTQLSAFTYYFGISTGSGFSNAIRTPSNPQERERITDESQISNQGLQELNKLNALDKNTINAHVSLPSGVVAAFLHDRDNGVSVRFLGVNYDAMVPSIITLPASLNQINKSNNKSVFNFSDIRGNGLMTMSLQADDGIYLSHFDGANFLPIEKVTSTFGTGQGYQDSSKNPVSFIDINGDGLADIVGFANDGVYVSLSNGNGFSAPMKWLDAMTVNHGWATQENFPRMFADINGDGLPDIVGFTPEHVYAAINTGAGFNHTGVLSTEFTSAVLGGNSEQRMRTVIDVNGDGMGDLVGNRNDGIYVALSTGNGFASASRWLGDFGDWWGSNKDQPRQLADVDGDGFPDIIGFGGDGVYVARQGRSQPADLITSVTDGLGRAVSMTYKPLTDSTVYTKGSGSTYPVIDIQVPMYVVSQSRLSNGLGGTNATDYTYGELRAEQGTGRGSQGFRWTKAKEAATGIESYTEYRQDWPFTGQVSLAESRLAGKGSGGVLKRIVTNYQQQTGSHSSTKFIFANSTTETSWDLNGVAYPTVTTTTAYNNWGDATQVKVTTSDGGSVTTNNEYLAANTSGGKWILGRLIKATVTHVTP